METVFNEIQHSVKNWWTSLLLGIVYIIVALWLMFSPVSSYIALSIIFSIYAVQRNFGNHFRHQQQERCSQLGMVRCRRNHRPYSRHLPDRLPDGQHGSHSVYHRLLAHVPWFLFYRLFHRPETLRNPRLGMVYGIRHSGYPLLIADIVATSHRSSLCSLHDLFHIPHHRTFPCHAFI